MKQSRDSLRQGYDRDYKSAEPPHLEPLFVGDWGPRTGHACWKCRDGTKPCVQGNPRRCEYPRARND